MMSSKIMASIAAASSAMISLQPSSSDEINPFTAPDAVISNHIIGIHDSQAPKYDVDSLFNVVSNIVKNTHLGQSLDLKRPKAVELIEDRIPQSCFMPPFSTLKEIAFLMTCKPFSRSTAHETVVGILEKLRSYTWDAKAVIALCAFASDYGDTCRLSLMEPTKENTLELHIFRLGEESKPSQSNLDLISTLIDITFKLIEGILTLEKIIADNTYSPRDVPTLYAAPRDLYTYWAILALLTCADRKTDLDWNVKSEVVGKLNHVLMRLNKEVTEIEQHKEAGNDRTWRSRVLLSPSGIVELLRALIFPRETVELEIFDNTLQQVVSNDVLKTKNLLLFISGLDNIENEISVLKSIHEALKKDREKQKHEILWIPVVNDETEISEEQAKFKHVKSSMPWYVLQNLKVIKGKKVVEDEWHYQGKPIVVVTNPRGEVIHKNALHMIFISKIEAFPFRPEDEGNLIAQWNWFWNEATKVHPEIRKWIWDDKYVFFYGGTDIGGTQRIGTLIEAIKKDPIIKQADAPIEHFNLSKLDPNSTSKFWDNISHCFLSLIQRNNHEQDPVLKDIQTLLSYKNEKSWILLSKGGKVLVLGYDPVVTSTLENFDEWRLNVQVLQGFGNEFVNYYNQNKPSVPDHCLHFELNNIRTRIPTSITCPEPSCRKKIMEIETVCYKCCHGIHYQNPSENLNSSETHESHVLKSKWAE
ncbi:protein SIEVE ELEMENT OCCLUSION B-like [Prosopis cineraria]|uniref:protein SIEVE ELEMENT OCCLUSION B-like n=1 Tax=Prosopis cineraria TaxID=364024 RepID=UPI0024106B3F|nr:protein SIEVE ELEMENT OCCLUSION B-like [Prosopis cineraria]